MPRVIELPDVQDLLAARRGQLVEVLPEEEFDWVHLPGALCLPLQTIDDTAAAPLRHEDPVVVYCNDFL